MSDPVNPSRELHLPLPTVVREFMQIGNQSTDRFNATQACLYTGLQFEELAEKMAVLVGGSLSSDRRAALLELQKALLLAAKTFKTGTFLGEFLRCDHNELIDADYDTAFVSIGAIMSESIAPLHAIAHGNFTNMAKFPDGKAERDENGKIKKPPGWQRPDFTPYIDNRIRD